jgi:hypothetical protein
LQRTLPAGFIAPYLPTKTSTPPSGALWLHEIKHFQARVPSRADGARRWFIADDGKEAQFTDTPSAQPQVGWPTPA